MRALLLAGGAVAVLSALAGWFPGGKTKHVEAAVAWQGRQAEVAVAATEAPREARRRERLLAGATRTRAVAAAAVGSWGEGSRVALPLFDGREMPGTVRLVRSRADGSVILGGELDEGGGFTLATDAGGRTAVEGLILPRGGSSAYRLARGDDGGALLVELPRGDVLCASLPRPPAAPRLAEMT